MENPSQFYFTTEECLASHRHWITKSYCEDHKTEEEIVALLQESSINITVREIHNCLISWSILPSPYISLAAVAAPRSHSSSASDNTSISLPATSDQCHELHQPTHDHAQAASLATQCSDTTQQCVNPPTVSPSTNYTINVSSHCDAQSTPDRDGLKVRCYHGDEHHEAETTLDCVPEGPSQLELYKAENHSHEKLAIMLEKRDVPRDHILRYTRAARTGSAAGTLREARQRRSERRSEKKRLRRLESAKRE